jgi:hypothetical protein
MMTMTTIFHIVCSLVTVGFYYKTLILVILPSTSISLSISITLTSWSLFFIKAVVFSSATWLSFESSFPN